MSPVNAVSGTKYPYGSYLTITAPAKTGYYASTVTSPVYMQSPLDYTKDVNVSSYITAGTVKAYRLTLSDLPAGITMQKVTRTASPLQGAEVSATKALVNNSLIYYGDRLYFEAETTTGYTPLIIRTPDNDDYINVIGNIKTEDVFTAGSVKSYNLTIASVDFVLATSVSRTSSPIKGAALGIIDAGIDVLYYNDVITITASPEPGLY